MMKKIIIKGKKMKKRKKKFNKKKKNRDELMDLDEQYNEVESNEKGV